MSENILVCCLVDFPAALLAKCDTQEVIRSMGIRLQACTVQDVVQQRPACHMLALYVTEEKFDYAIGELRSFVESVNTGRMDLLLVCPLSFSCDLYEMWLLGMHSVVPVSEGLDSFYLAVSRIAATRRELENMASQLKEASDIALLSMSASSQLGEIVRFMEKAINANHASNWPIF